MINTNSIIVASSKQRYSKLEQEVVILNLKSEAYYSLNAVGAEIWNLIQEPKSVSEIVISLGNKYEIDEQKCESDLLSLLNELSAIELIEVSQDNMAAEKPVQEIKQTTSEAKEVWTTPALASYGTMATLVHGSGGSGADAQMGVFDGNLNFDPPAQAEDTVPAGQLDEDAAVTGLDDPGSGDDYTNEYPY
ncbi:Coenzyme PQQ synthesis protein D (PqqD) [Xenococcus sp. PCC 7305]|uniref:PqqD family peptide modification chaperone n=1 Tax=Xenococcus sp. PCC 7305 TaxID=102125 RepID=UPI0002ACCFA0|nr:PqqD family peptide modification chaperone [Xenococcus sp. PCC 7305]ELS05342.1 Coenzyme PQQ synthesis protein D (PqqD) [Xenococcus sp. PCC 7305]